MNLALFYSDANLFAAKLIDSWIQSDEHDLQFTFIMEPIDIFSQSLIGCISLHWNVLLDL